MKNKIKISPFSPLAASIIKIGLPIISLIFMYILIYLIGIPENKRAWVVSSTYAMLEYAVMSFTLIVCGALIADTAVKNNN